MMTTGSDTPGIVNLHMICNELRAKKRSSEVTVPATPLFTAATPLPPHERKAGYATDW